MGAGLGWFRFVCANGLIVGVGRTVRRRHDLALDVEDIGAVFAEGLKAAEAERTLYVEWLRREVDSDRVRRLVDGALAQTWGKKAAARAFHIVRTGSDGAFAEPFERATPSCRRMRATEPVPGARGGSHTAFAVAQALAWLARQRRFRIARSPAR